MRYHRHRPEKGVGDLDIEGQIHSGTVQKWIVNILHPEGKFLRIWKLIFLASCVFSVSVDPLFFYLPVINDEKKCVVLDRRLHVISICLRTVLDSISLGNIILQCCCPYIDKNARPHDEGQDGVLVTDAWPIAKRYLWSRSFAIDVLSILPIPQVLVPIIFLEMRGSNGLNTRKMLNAVVLSQYVPRITRIYLSWRKVRKNTTLPVITIAVKAGFNLFLYIVASHVLGAFWYLFSIQRETACWHLACEKYSGCNRSSLNCDHSFGTYKFLDNYCPVEEKNSTMFDFGIFHEALQSGTVASMDFPRKFFYCFWWGLRSLSSLGQNLQTSPYFWENCFTVLISIIGLLLLLYFIGNLQMYMQWETQKQLETYMDKNDIAKMRSKEQSVELWIQRNNLPDPIKKQIMDHIKQRLQEKRNDIDAENPFPHLPIFLRQRIKRHICLPMLKNVPMRFREAISERQLQLDICEYIKQVYYSEDTYIIREGEPLDRMLFVTKGVVWKFATTNNNGVGSTVSSSHGECIEKGCYCGEEILNWGFHGFSQHILPNLSDLPISDKTLKTHTKVEAFALMANDLKALVSRYAEPTPTEAVLMIQEAWRRRNKVLNWQSRARNT